MDLKTKAVAAALRVDEDLCLKTHNPRYVWHAWQLARRAKAPIAGWVLQFIDQLAKSEITTRSRKTDNADRYEAALTQMDAAVASHKRRLRVRMFETPSFANAVQFRTGTLVQTIGAARSPRATLLLARGLHRPVGA